MADQKPNNRERVKEIVEGIEKNIQELFQSEKYFDYLRTMSRFHNYSLNNTLLIYAQRPDAAQPVAGFQKWKQFGRHVRKGEKGLTIIAPTPLKRKIEEMKLDPDTNAPVIDRDGNIMMEEKTIEIPFFKPVKVFSADQTEGKPLPTLVADLTGDVRQYEAFMEALRRTSPMPLSIVPLPPDLDGLCNHSEQTISIREGMSEVQTVCAAVHEITHAVLHNRDHERIAGEGEQKKDKSTIEIEAESCSYSVLAYYGIDTSANSMGYILTWSSGKDLKELKASLDTITKTTHSLITSIDKHFAEICKERGIDLSPQPDTPESYVKDFFDHLQQAYEAGLIANPLPISSREEAERVFLNDIYVGCFTGFRDILRDMEEQAHMPANAALLERLEALRDQLDAALICKIEPMVSPETAVQHSIIQTYEQKDGQLIPGKVVFSGTLDECQRIMAGLDAGTITLRDMREPDFEPPEQTLTPVQDKPLDEYPMPDSSLSGELGNGLLPLSRNRAAELLEQDMTVYMIQNGAAPEMVFDRDDLMEQPEGTLFAVPREEWEKSRDFRDAVAGRMNRQEEREAAFLAHAGNCFAIYQLRNGEETRYLQYEPLPAQGVDKKFYELAYTAPLPDGANLETLFEKFNIDHPPDYLRPSMSVSDIIALKQDGVVSCYYCDRYAFTELHGFFSKGNEPVKEEPKHPTVAELEAQVKAGQSISLMDLAVATHRERDGKKKSVSERLKRQSPQEPKKKAVKKNMERGI